MKKLFIIFVSLAFLVGVLIVFGQKIRNNRTSASVSKTVMVDKLERKYNVYIPKSLTANKKVPLVFVFHGGGGTAEKMETSVGFDELADRDNFIVIYPQGMGNNWNDGRETDVLKAQKENVDDLAFIKKILEEIGKDYKIDEKRIYATGASNGGIFSHYVGANLSDKFAAIAPVIGGIADPFHKKFNPEKPVSVFIIQGTDDKLVPYNGGNVARNRGKVIGTDEAVAHWTKANKTDKEPVTGALPDSDKRDGCTVETFLWKNGKNNSEVKLFKLNGGGHTWAGKNSKLVRFLVGNVCNDFDATEVIWEFFKAHPKP
jgi:polyhydroxybutyrate depolymerase